MKIPKISLISGSYKGGASSKSLIKDAGESIA